MVGAITALPLPLLQRFSFWALRETVSLPWIGGIQMTRLLSDVDGETVTASYSPRTPWEILVEICKQEEVIPEIIVHWADYREHRYTLARCRVLRKLLEQLSVKTVAKMTGIGDKRLYQIAGVKDHGN